MSLLSLTKKFIKETNKIQPFDGGYNPAKYKSEKLRNCYKKYLLKLISYCAKNDVSFEILDGFRLWEELSHIIYVFNFSVPYPGINVVIKSKNDIKKEIVATALYDRYNVISVIDEVEKELDADSLAYLLLKGIDFNTIRKHLNLFFKSNDARTSKYLKAKREGKIVTYDPDAYNG